MYEPTTFRLPLRPSRRHGKMTQRMVAGIIGSTWVPRLDPTFTDYSDIIEACSRGHTISTVEAVPDASGDSFKGFLARNHAGKFWGEQDRIDRYKEQMERRRETVRKVRANKAAREQEKWELLRANRQARQHLDSDLDWALEEQRRNLEHERENRVRRTNPVYDPRQLDLFDDVWLTQEDTRWIKAIADRAVIERKMKLEDAVSQAAQEVVDWLKNHPRTSEEDLRVQRMDYEAKTEWLRNK